MPMMLLFTCTHCGHEFAAADDFDADDDDPAPARIHCPMCHRKFDPYAAPPSEVGPQTGTEILRPTKQRPAK